MYAQGMNGISALTHDITKKRVLSLIITKGSARNSKIDLIHNLILAGPLFLLAADEWIPSFELPRMVRSKTVEVKQTLAHLYTVRASTCYRLLDTLSAIPAKGQPMLVLDILHTFFDSHMRLPSRLQVLRQCCNHLKRIARERPVMIMNQAMPEPEYEHFLPLLQSIALKTLYLEYGYEPIPQPTLF